MGDIERKANVAGQATLTLNDGRKYDFPVYEGQLGPAVIDLRQLYHQTGAFTYDPGFMSTASCASNITYIDGEQGILLHRGYAIEELARYSDFLEVSYLLLNGELPNKAEKDDFKQNIAYHSLVHEQLINFYRGFRRDAHPMAILVGVVGALSAFYHDSLDIYDPEQRLLASYRLIAKMPNIAAMAYRYAIGRPFMYPKNSLSYAANFLYMTFGVPTEEYIVDDAVVRALDRILILHADHEQNASTSTVRLVGSTGSNPFACISAGIAALWGPAHGGANEAVLDMLQHIGTKDNIPAFIEKVKKKKAKLMGFGHRVYKNYDPRATVLKESAHEVLQTLGVNDPCLEIALALETIALEDDYFIERKLFPNVDFYSGIILRAMGFPRTMFTALFALARTVGWIAQWQEMIADKELKIARPRQLYTGHKVRPFTPMEER